MTMSSEEKDLFMQSNINIADSMTDGTKQI